MDMTVHDGKLSDAEQMQLDELNQICRDCISYLSQDYKVPDLSNCMMCPVGRKLHMLDKDSIDGHNSGKYEKYFDS